MRASLQALPLYASNFNNNHVGLSQVIDVAASGVIHIPTVKGVIIGS